MFKQFMSGLLASAATLAFLLPTTGRSLNLPIRAETGQPGHISVSGEAEVRVIPDQVVLTLGVQTWDEDLDDAKHRNDRIIQKVTALAGRYNIPAKHVKTDYINVEPRYEDYYEASRLQGYVVRKSIVVTLSDLEKFEGFLTEALESGVNYVHGIEFRTTQLREHRDEARALAVTAAKEKAQAMARELDLQVGDPVEIYEESAGWYSWYSRSWWGSHFSGMSQNVIQDFGNGMSLEDSGIAPGQISVKARVSVQFNLLP